METCLQDRLTRFQQLLYSSSRISSCPTPRTTRLPVRISQQHTAIDLVRPSTAEGMTRADAYELACFHLITEALLKRFGDHGTITLGPAILNATLWKSRDLDPTHIGYRVPDLVTFFRTPQDGFELGMLAEFKTARKLEIAKKVEGFRRLLQVLENNSHAFLRSVSRNLGLPFEVDDFSVRKEPHLLYVATHFPSDVSVDFLPFQPHFITVPSH